MDFSMEKITGISPDQNQSDSVGDAKKKKDVPKIKPEGLMKNREQEKKKDLWTLCNEIQKNAEQLVRIIEKEGIPNPRSYQDNEYGLRACSEIIGALKNIRGY